MSFKRATWRSGLTYQQTCRECKTTVTYTDDLLDFRPWYADGFVYCPTCRTPLRHNEGYAINAPIQAGTNVDLTAAAPAAPAAPVAPAAQAPAGKAPFCHQCGKQYHSDDAFCSGCGAKRH